MANRNEHFEDWFESYFQYQQGQDSPYSYADVLEAFREGWRRSKLSTDFSGEDVKGKNESD